MPDESFDPLLEGLYSGSTTLIRERASGPKSKSGRTVHGQEDVSWTYIMMRLLALAALFAPVAFSQEQFIDWLSDYRQALTEAKAAKKPVFLEFRCEA